MQARKKLTIPIDLKLNSMIPLPQFIQNDTNILEFTVKDNGVDADLSNITRIVVNYKRLDKKVISRLLTATGNTILYEIGLEEMEVPGPGEMELQFFENEDRISTKRFKVNMLASIGTDAIYENTEQMTVLQELFVEVDTVKAETEIARLNADTATEAANTAAANAQQVADDNKTNWLSPVSAFADIATTYPSPANGDQVQTISDGKEYRFNQNVWEQIRGFSSSAIADLQVKHDQVVEDLVEKANKSDLETEVTTKRTHLNSLSADNAIPFEIHNQAGQAGVDVSSEVTHHYTDASAKVIDNVGDGTILTLSNAQNNIMRPDKPTDYVGNGNVLRYRKFNNDTKTYQDILIIDPKGNIERNNIEEALTFINRKTNNGFPAFTFDSPTAQTIPFNFRNGGSLVTFQDEVTFTKAVIASGSVKTTGLELRAGAGSLFLSGSATGNVQMLYNGTHYRVQPIIAVTTTNRPSTNLVSGMQIFDTILNKPIWRNAANNGWVDATGTTV